MDYLKNSLKDVHMAVWVMLGVVSVVLTGLVALDEYEKSKRDAARATTATSAAQPAR